MIYCKWSKSLGALEDDALKIWGTPPYRGEFDDCIFFGMFDFYDYWNVWCNQGYKWVLWAGSDILRLQNRPNWQKKILLYLVKDAEHWVENETEKQALNSMGIKVKGVCPSFLGDVNKFEIVYRPKIPMDVYVSTAEGFEREYGFTTVLNIADSLPDINFYLYGSNSWKKWYEENPQKQKKNVIMRGRVSKEIMNNEIADMQVALRLNEFDGFSEVLAKAVLMGQYAIGKVEHPLIPTFKNDMDLILKLNMLRHKKVPNLKVREYYLQHLNDYPWNIKKN